jgi:hypothetical protein
LLAATSAFSFLEVRKINQEKSANFAITGSEIMPTESSNQDHVFQTTIVMARPQPSKVFGVQQGGTPFEPAPGSGRRFAADPHTRGVFAIHPDHNRPHVAWASATGSRQVGAIYNFPELWRARLATRGPEALHGSDHHAPLAQILRIGAQEPTVPGCMAGLDEVPRAGRHSVEGEETHVLEVPGSVHSQAPPVS